MKKRIIVSVIIISILVTLFGGGKLGYHWYQSRTTVAEVYPVESLVWWNYFDNPMSSYGVVTNEDSQNVYLLNQQAIQEVFVTEGQEVKAGDALISYDMTLVSLDLEIKQLEISNIDNEILLAKQTLERLKNIKPIPDLAVAEMGTMVAMSAPVAPLMMAAPPIIKPSSVLISSFPTKEVEKTGEAYNYLTVGAESWAGTGSLEEPLRYLCTLDSYVEGAFLNWLRNLPEETFAVLEIYTDDDPSQPLISAWQIHNRSLPAVAGNYRWSILTKEQIIDPIEPPPPTPPPIEPPPEPSLPEPPPTIPDGPGGTSYTAAELREEINKTQDELRNLDLKKRRTQLELEQMQKLNDSGLVTAEMDGIVISLDDKDHPKQDGSPFLTVAGSEGLYVSGSLSELLLGEVQLGQVVTANSWESNLSFEATIQEISPYPTNGGDSWFEGNPNVSYYPYIAYIANTNGLQNGENVMLLIDTSSEEEMQGAAFYLQMAYVRTESSGQSYVLKEGENGRLVKQYVETGKTLFGQAVEILSGLSEEDRIAFPYGQTAKEGVRTKEGTNIELGGW